MLTRPDSSLFVEKSSLDDGTGVGGYTGPEIGAFLGDTGKSADAPIAGRDQKWKVEPYLFERGVGPITE